MNARSSSLVALKGCMAVAAVVTALSAQAENITITNPGFESAIAASSGYSAVILVGQYGALVQY